MPSIRKIQVIAGMMLAFGISTTFAQQAIMATGDSITAGQLRPSYRQPLLDELSALGCTVDMVGDQTLNSFDYQAPAGTTGAHFPGFTPALGYDTDHQAFGRIRAEQLLDGATSSQYTIQPIAQYMQAEQPDYVLLHIGTNDLNVAIFEGMRTNQQINNWATATAAEVEQLIDTLQASHSNPANLRILLANFIPYKGPFTAQAQIDAAIRASAVYTSKLETLVENRADSRVLIVDVATGFDLASMADDDVHPNQIGEEHVAGAFVPVLFGAGLCPDTVPAITSPTNGSTTTGAPLIITWDDNGLDIDRWRVYVGDSQSGNSSTWLDSGGLGAGVRSVTVPNLPEDGSNVFVSLNYRSGGVWNQLLTSFISEPAVITVPEIVSPAPGSELPGATVSFLWQDNGTNATQWYFRIGSTVGGEQYASTRISNGAQRSAVFSGLPVDGSRVYVEFSYRAPSGTWISTNLAYDAALLTGNNEAPVAVADSVTGVAPGDTRFISVLENDTDPDGTIDSGTVLITAKPSEGSVEVLGRGRIRYTHNGGTTSGTDTFRYTVNDDDGATSNEALVTINVNDPDDGNNNRPPVALDNSAGPMLVGESLTFPVLNNDSDSDGFIDVSTVTIIRQPTSGTATARADGLITYVHDGSGPGTDTLTYTVKDNEGSVSNEATVTIRPIQTVGTLPDLINPAPGGQLPGSDVTFEWTSNDTAVTQFYLRVGRSEGASEFAEQRITDPSKRQYTVTGLPADGSTTVHVQFSYYRSVGGWTIRNFTYLAASSGT